MITNDMVDCRDHVHTGPQVDIKGHLISSLRFGDSPFHGRVKGLVFRWCGCQDTVSFLLLVSH
jgi:hypothetical protein